MKSATDIQGCKEATMMTSAVQSIESWPIDRLIEYARNPRKNDSAVDRMCASIREFGFKIPILARSDGEVVDGHLRLKAARKLGITEVPVMLCDEWTPAQVKAFRLMVIHGNGMPGLQGRSKQGEDTNAFDLPFDGPGTFRVKLVRTGVRIFMCFGKDGSEPKEIAHTEVSFTGAVLVGLVVCSHRADAANTVIFSDVSLEAQVPPAARAQ